LHRIKYRSPWIAVLWSICIPGFGQFYNRDFLVGLTLLFLEFLINVNANLNLAIFYSFRGSFPQVYQVSNIQWLLFYPCVYAFAAWQAYNKAIEINNNLNDDSNEPNRRTRLNGFFAGFAMGGTLGVIYNGSIGYVFSGILGGFLGAVTGSIIEVIITQRPG